MAKWFIAHKSNFDTLECLIQWILIIWESVLQSNIRGALFSGGRSEIVNSQSSIEEKAASIA